MTLKTKGSVVFLLSMLGFLSACSSWHLSAKRHVDAEGVVSARAFRQLFPEPTGISDMLKLLATAQSILIEKTKDGGRASVALYAADGSYYEGEDQFSSSPSWIWERRDNYEAVATEAGVCLFRDKKWSCTDSDYSIGLPDIAADDVTEAHAYQAMCRAVPCLALHFVVANAIEVNGERMLSSNPFRGGRRFVITLDRDSLEPLRTVDTQYFEDGSVATAIFIWNLDAEIDQLPSMPAEAWSN
jgi:hypothetical protein